jgi:hypothetical protein
VTPGFVYAHAGELGAHRLGDGPRARLRFDLADVDAWLSACSARRGSAAAEPAPRGSLRRRREKPLGTTADLLPIRGRIRPTDGLREASWVRTR